MMSESYNTIKDDNEVVSTLVSKLRLVNEMSNQNMNMINLSR